jgi:hypothetical protein
MVIVEGGGGGQGWCETAARGAAASFGSRLMWAAVVRLGLGF